MKRTAVTASRENFAGLLLKWHIEQNTRQMPWKNEKDPYKIWLSEVILQQTRVEQGLNYYTKFVKTFPGIHELAGTPDPVVFKLWEGLGYYTRCRNLIATARYISKERNGQFPATYEEIKALKGVGPYTAAAISSFAFNLPHAVVDGNVFRVLARIFGIDIPIDSAAGKKTFTTLANELLDKKLPGQFNQAIMDFGAVVCKPVAPLCSECIFNKQCFAFREKKTGHLPVKEKKIRIRKRWFYYLLPEYNDQLYIRQRNENDIWQQLFEFPLIESGKELRQKDILKMAETQFPFLKNNYQVLTISPVYRQQLSHQLITGRFIRMRLIRKYNGNKHWILVKKSQATDYAFPKFINQYLHAGEVPAGLS
jgi:A/G-specific adenine glycosylase